MPTPAADFTIFDGQELVVYTPSGGSPIENVPALRRPLTKSSQRNVESFVELHATDVVFHLDGTSLAGASLAAGDTLTTRQASIIRLYLLNGSRGTESQLPFAGQLSD